MICSSECLDRFIVRSPKRPGLQFNPDQTAGATSESNEPAPKLYVTKLESGSVVAEIVPYAVLLGTVIATMDSGIIVSDFTRRLWVGIKAFADPMAAKAGAPAGMAPTREDAEDIQAFVKPLAGKSGAQLGIKHARFEKRDGPRSVVAEYSFDETELNRAAVNIDHALELPSFNGPLVEVSMTEGSIMREVMLFFEQASRKPGKEKGRTADKGIVPDVSPKALPVYFRKSFQDLKDQMVRGEVNPLTNSAFVVDVHVQRIDGEAKGYIVTDVHEVIPLGGDD